MRKFNKIWLLTLFLLAAFALPAFAVTDAEVQAQVAATSKEAVSGNLFIWFLCAVAFLKISQKIDSFMGSLGINVGHTGGNLMAEAMIAARGIQMGRQVMGGGSGGYGKSGGTGQTGPAGSSSGGGGTRFLQGGLAGAASRQFTQSAMHSATNQGGNMITSNAFKTSMAKGGDFANSIISNVAQGDIRQMGNITGDTANQAVVSYMGHTGKPDAPSYSDAEIGGGRIIGTETSAADPGGVQFGMYHAEQYMAPEGDYDVVQSVDGAKWYRQYAVDSVEKIPYEKPDGKVAYDESIIQKLPPIPRRKDRV